jgi:hypothetical protein
MNEQVRILKQKDLLPLPLPPPRVCSLEPVATNPFPAQLRIFAYSLFWAGITQTCSRETISGGWGERMRLTTGAELTYRLDPTSEHICYMQIWLFWGDPGVRRRS